MNASSAAVNSSMGNAVLGGGTSLNANSNLDPSAQISQPMRTERGSEGMQQNRLDPGQPTNHGPMNAQDYEVVLDQNNIADQCWVREELQCENEDWRHDYDELQREDEQLRVE